MSIAPLAWFLLYASLILSFSARLNLKAGRGWSGHRAVAGTSATSNKSETEGPKSQEEAIQEIMTLQGQHFANQMADLCTRARNIIDEKGRLSNRSKQIMWRKRKWATHWQQLQNLARELESLTPPVTQTSTQADAQSGLNILAKDFWKHVGGRKDGEVQRIDFQAKKKAMAADDLAVYVDWAFGKRDFDVGALQNMKSILEELYNYMTDIMSNPNNVDAQVISLQAKTNAQENHLGGATYNAMNLLQWGICPSLARKGENCWG